MTTPRGTARQQRRIKRSGDKMLPPSAMVQAAHEADRKRASRKLGVKLFHKAGAGI